MWAAWMDCFGNNKIYCYLLSKMRCRHPLRSPSERGSSPRAGSNVMYWDANISLSQNESIFSVWGMYNLLGKLGQLYALLMPWLKGSCGHQQPLYWLYKHSVLPSSHKNPNHLHDMIHISIKECYCQTSNINRTLVGNNIVDHSDVVGESPVGAAPTTSSFST